MSEDNPMNQGPIPRAEDIAAQAADIAQERISIPFKPDHGAEKTHGYAVDPDFDKAAFNAQYGPPDQETFAGVSLDEAVNHLKSKDDPNLMKMPPEMEAVYRPKIMQDIDDRQQAAAKDKSSFTGISNAPSHHAQGNYKGDEPPRLVNH